MEVISDVTKSQHQPLIIEEWNGSSSTKLFKTATISASPSLYVHRSTNTILFFFCFCSVFSFHSRGLSFLFFLGDTQIRQSFQPYLEASSPSFCTRGKFNPIIFCSFLLFKQISLYYMS